MRSPAFLAVTFFVSVSGSVSAAPPDPAVLAEKIDQHLARSWEKANIKPAPQTDDAAFARRIYLDLVGRIPTVAEVRSFLDDKSPNKRAKLVDQLVSSGAYARHTSTFWRRIWIPQADTPQFARLTDNFEEWLAIKIADNTPYDEIVQKLLVNAPAARQGRGPQRGGGNTTASQTFFAASESKPENLAANTARAFLGINLDCAQCHDHPFAKWTRNQFWETAAFFAMPGVGPEVVIPFFAAPFIAKGSLTRLEMTIPNTKKIVSAATLTGGEPKWPAELSPATGAQMLATWVTAKDNPFFAKNAANRLWADLYGIGISEPLDDLGGESTPSHPELLDELGKAFAESGYDMKYLTKALVLSKAYQLSSESHKDRSPASDSPKLFSRMPVRGLTGEQLHDSLRVAAGLPAERGDLDPLNALRERKRFTTMFHTDRAANAQRSIIQSLTLMNGSATDELTNPAKTPTIASTADAPFLDTRAKVEALFLAALGRKPTAKEWDAFVKHVEKSTPSKGMSKALADAFWALINSSEFSTNH